MVVSMTQAQLKSMIAEAVAAAGGKSIVGKKQKDPNAPKKDPSSWALFMKRLSDLLKSNDIKLPGPTIMQLAGSFKDHKGTTDYDSWTDQDILSFHSTWEKPEHSKAELAKMEKGTSDTASSSGEEGVKKRRGPKKLTEMSVEEKAEHDRKVIERREAKDALKEKETAAAPAPAKVVASKKAVKIVAPVAKPEPSEDEFIKKTIGGKNYFWNPTSNHCYKWNNGSQGDWAGIFDTDSGKIDTTAEEPMVFEEQE